MEVTYALQSQSRTLCCSLKAPLPEARVVRILPSKPIGWVPKISHRAYRGSKYGKKQSPVRRYG